ncbi:transglutaminase-like domain-containing protein [Candidatus Parcubacteria bacterium]|nr:transglutaminase-like domain-containing protein [Candidatus Parcubacteria bacterium]
MLDKIKKIKKKKVDRSFIIEVLQAIKEEFDSKLHTITTTHDFKTSRFISVKEVLEKRQRSCGSMSTVVASVLRNFGVSVKLINGMFIKDNPNMRHAWIEVWLDNEWVPFDITKKNFALTPYHIRLGEYVDWEDLKKEQST